MRVDVQRATCMGIDPMLCDLLTTRPECAPFEGPVDHKRGSVLPAGPDLDIAKVFHPQDGRAARKKPPCFLGSWC